jgi:large subunit ribosomal protein L30
MAKSLRVTLVRSGINRPEHHKRTIAGLGLSKLGVSRTLPDNVSVRGMIRAVSHLVRVQKADE